MIKLVKKAIEELFLMGLGAARITRNKAEKTINVFLKNGMIDNKEAKAIVNKVMSEAEKVKNMLNKEGLKEAKQIKEKLGKASSNAVKCASKKITKIAIKLAKEGIK
jgi:polyhydroxyalkanoate synthesis regulator phasin